MLILYIKSHGSVGGHKWHKWRFLCGGVFPPNQGSEGSRGIHMARTLVSPLCLFRYNVHAPCSGSGRVFKRDYGNAHNTTLQTGIMRVDAESSTKLSDLKILNPQSNRSSFEACNIIGNFTGVQKGAQRAHFVHCLQKFINLCMKDGKKSKSYKIILNTLCRLSLSDISFGSKMKIQKTSGHFTNNIESRARRNLLSVSKGTLGLSLLMNAIDNVKPIIEVKKVRISGTTQLVPCIIPKKRQISLAIRWIVEAAIVRRNTKKSMSLDQCFLAELVDASQNIGTVRKRRDDLHKLAESNRGFAHYRWW